jgi:hypothetical protein
MTAAIKIKKLDQVTSVIPSSRLKPTPTPARILEKRMYSTTRRILKMLIKTASFFPRKYPAKMTGRKKKLRNANLKWTRNAMARMPTIINSINEPSKCLRKNVLMVFISVSGK